MAHLSQLWLDRGKEACNLFADLANPVSNRAYMSVGYVQLLESRIYTIEKA
jgi:predicted GNAT family acetyltransferase